jgi:hypothetical protein
MQIGSIANASTIAAMTKGPKSAEAPGPDNDSNSDDSGSAKSVTAAGIGTTVDVSA